TSHSTASTGAARDARSTTAHAPVSPGRRRAGQRLRRILSLDDFEPAARRHLPGPIFAYIAGAVETNASLRANREAYGRYAFLTNVLVDISKRTQATALFGHTYAAPFGIAPMGISALSAY